MACREYEKRLAELEDLFEGRLDGPGRARLEAHLAACEACRAEMAQVREAVALLRQGLEPAPEASPAFFPRLGARLREVETERVVADFWGALELLARRTAAVAGMAVLLVASFLAGRALTMGPVEPPAPQVSEIFSEPPRPVSHDDVLVSLAVNGRAARSDK